MRRILLSWHSTNSLFVVSRIMNIWPCNYRLHCIPKAAPPNNATPLQPHLPYATPLQPRPHLCSPTYPKQLCSPTSFRNSAALPTLCNSTAAPLMHCNLAKRAEAPPTLTSRHGSPYSLFPSAEKTVHCYHGYWVMQIIYTAIRIHVPNFVHVDQSHEHVVSHHVTACDIT